LLVVSNQNYDKKEDEDEDEDDIIMYLKRVLKFYEDKCVR